MGVCFRVGREVIPGSCAEVWLSSLYNSGGWQGIEVCFSEYAGIMPGPHYKASDLAAGLY